MKKNTLLPPHGGETDPRWAAVAARDAAADGQFYYAVATTGVYCRPSCAARRPRPENVSFHPTRQAAEAAGFRPCQRCHPGQPGPAERNAALAAAACRFIEAAETAPRLGAVAAHVGVSASHLHRLFRRATGLTPHAYAAAHRGCRVRAQLARGGSVTDALYAAGFNSNGRFYASADRLLGMAPSAFRDGGAATAIRYAVGACTLGAVLAAHSPRGICAILLGDDPEELVRDLERRFPRARLARSGRRFDGLLVKVVRLIETPAIGLELPLDIRGTVFQQRVWNALRRIPAGTTASYTAIARAIGRPQAARAVAQACAANPLAIAIPCHRAVGGGGELRGYRWGVARKRALLQLEATEAARPAQN